MSDKITEIFKAGLAFAVLAIPHFSDFLAALGGEAAVMQNVAGAYAIYHMVGLAVDYFRGKAAALAAALLLLLLPATPALAQAPDDRGGIVLAYNLTNLEVGMDRASGWTLEGEARIPQLPVVSLAAHISATDTEPGWTFTGFGPRATFDAGAIKFFAHWLVGNVNLGDMSKPGLDHKGGGGVMIPLGRHWEIQLGGDHDGDYAHGRLGVGWRF